MWGFLAVSERAVHVIDWTLDHGVAIVLLQGEVVWACRDEYEDTVRDALNLNKWPLLVIDVENAEFVDINIIAGMVQRQRVLRRLGGGLVLFGESKCVTAAMSSLGVSTVLPTVFSSLRDARRLVVQCSTFTEAQVRARNTR
jgi:anti-anti-sigma regulatory factor